MLVDEVCAQTPLGLPQAIPHLSSIWEDILLDFIIILPAHQGQIVILVIIDHFLKAAHFGTLPTHLRHARQLNSLLKLQATRIPEEHHLQ